MASKIILNRPSLIKARNRRPQRIQYQCFNLDIPEKVQATLSGKFYYIHTYGCQANVRDEESMAGLLESAGMKRTDMAVDASVIILNTCAIRANAEDKLFGEIGSIKALKRLNKDLIVIISGCMVQQESALEKLEKSYPQVDIFFGTNSVHKVLELIDLHLNSKKKVIDVNSEDITIYEDVPVARVEDFKAFVNITYGCDKFCTYCIVPYTRGKERSRKFADILNECEILVRSGYQEITLVGQNVNAYGIDLKLGESFADLLEAVAKLGIPRLRFITSHPWNFDDAMITVIAKYDNIMKAIHLPLQSGNNHILKLMGRRYSVDSYLELVAKLKAKMPTVALTTDIIVGFPNETEEQFADTLRVFEQVGYSGAFTFIYSPREGTPAAKMIDDVTLEAKHQRFNRLKDLVEISTGNYAATLVGQIKTVLVDGASKKNDQVLSGFTEENKVVHFIGREDLVGKIVKVKILASHVYHLEGALVNE
ncbi:MAG TPA: tRNA (N6-isopentenyl adenosine(37)-C2)-methylthiotransferase MiaB [Bacilli bacterium]|nr:tRNA (N6-isopentenyl adenosine(37)-C2)-methylthiotransferase MiaB [Bacilli bacterium]